MLRRGDNDAVDGERDDLQMFELAPVSLWLEDYSALKTQFEAWRQAGVTDLRSYLHADTSRVKTCASCIQLLKVNQKTLILYEAHDFADLTENLGRVFRDDMLPTHIEELAQLWDGQQTFASLTVNYTLAGHRLDIQLSGSVLPGHEGDWARVLIAIEDVTERETARRRLTESERYARGLFAHSPVSLWVEDFGAVKQLLDQARDRGITDLRVFTDVHPEFVERCMSEIRVLDVNQHTLDLFHAADLDELLRRLGEIFRDEMRVHFREQLLELWQGHLFHRREVVNYALDGSELHLHLQFSVLPGHEADWSRVQVALTDITARKKAEAYLEFLGKHDVLTKLCNRSFYADELNRLERKGPFPVAVIVVDLNGLKETNDQLGHAAGDALLRRIGEVLNKAIGKPAHAARIGGDEFAILMPGADEPEAEAMMEDIDRLVEVNNQFYAGPAMSLAMGAAIAPAGERLEETVKRADRLMYEAKRAYYEAGGHDRRQAAKPASDGGPGTRGPDTIPSTH